MISIQNNTIPINSALSDHGALHLFTDNATMKELEDMSAAIEAAKMRKEKERTIIQHFGEPYLTTKRKNGKSIEYFRVDYRDQSGKRQQMSAKSRSALIDKLWNRFMSENPAFLLSNATVAEVYGKYLTRRKELVDAGALSSQTAEYDIYNWNRFFANCNFVDLPINKTSTYLLELEFRKICGDGTKYTKKAFLKGKSLMNGIYQEAVMNGIIPTNYAANVSLDLCKFIVEDFSEETEQCKYYSREEVQTLRAYLRTLPKDTYSLGILLHTYLVSRVGETRALTWDDYNPETGEMNIWHEITQKKQGDKKDPILISIVPKAEKVRADERLRSQRRQWKWLRSFGRSTAPKSTS